MKYLSIISPVVSVLCALCWSSVVLAGAVNSLVVAGTVTTSSSGYIGFTEEINISGKDLINEEISLGGLDKNYGVSISAVLECRGFSKAEPGDDNVIPCFSAGPGASQEVFFDDNGVKKIRIMYEDFISNPYVVTATLNYEVQITYFDHDAILIYDDALAYGAENYLLTGDGQEVYTTVDFNSPEVLSGSAAIAVTTHQDAGQGASHWKLMLFANGAAASYPGVDLRGKKELSFSAKASQPVQLEGAFGSPDDTSVRTITPMSLTTHYQQFTVDISNLNLADINTFLWVSLHKERNPVSYTGVTVYLDNIIIQ